ncbi:hypothetical protein HMPREF1529_01787 [Microbacterium sp. oral taxon 186 str. F0373]|uniref:hypothetical protein n=1 Tax=Microbacterium sp. oral taxon 186 TaxID=712383 RepID=UPI00034EBBD7|nr:hypothetical protein [Microbacterium sp. oral taxon 186]EPD85172.1 hypothetical protein HMPREF1529_01787 [Microbacterium sp. oral taxon 186 str. F0373]
MAFEPTPTQDDRRGRRQSAADDGGRLYGIWSDGQLASGVMFVSFSAPAGQCEIGCWLEPAAEVGD